MIRILEDHVVNQIAAGEVVERPASVVKELLENALDAGSKRIDIALRDGGRALIRVADDGCGMGHQDALLCIERHATSKIRTTDDLVHVGTLGFRGEALPSIAAVCRFTLVTRREEDDVATRLLIEGGCLEAVESAGAPKGSTVEVKSLFFNVPARRKFLRTEATELAHCLEVITRVLLLENNVDVCVKHGDRELLRASAVPSRADRIRALLGPEGRSLVPACFEARGVAVEGLVSPVGVHRGDSTGSSYTYVNGRFVRDPVLRRAVGEAYRGIVPKGRYPLVVLDVRMDPERVDVNVHPSKIEVRFRDPWEIAEAITGGLRRVLEAEGIRTLPADHVPANHGGTEITEAARRIVPTSPPCNLRVFGDSVVDHSLSDDSALPMLVHEPPPVLPVPRFRDLRVLGQVRGTYIVCEGSGELVIVDQHAAHERVSLHRLLRNRREHMGFGAQRLLTPELVELTLSQASALRDHLEILSDVGLEIAPSGPSTFAITAVPPVLAKADLQRLVRAVADEVLAETKSVVIEDLVEHLLATMACHMSVRAAEPLSLLEMQALLASLDEVDVAVCAHGRPVVIRIGVGELERRFNRT